MVNDMEKVFYIDLSEVTTKEELQDLLVRELPLPDYYGKNLDALHDILTECNQWNLIFYNSTKSQKVLGKYFNALCRMCEDALEENENLKIRFFA